MIKILHVLSSGLIGGTERMTVRLIRQMNPDKFTNHVAFFRGDGPIGDDLRTLGVPVTVLDWSLSNCVGGSRRLVALLRAEQYDIVQVYGLKANMVVRPIAKLVGVPVLITAQRSVDLDRRPWHSLADRLTSPLVDLYLSNSEAAAKLLVTRERIPVRKVRTVHNGIDCGPIASRTEQRDDVRAELDIQPFETCIGVVARLEPPKGLEHFMQALSLIPPEVPIKAVVVGDGELHDQLVGMASALGLLPQRLKFLGLRHDVGRLLAGFDLFVLPSLWEGIPGAVMEAMCAGLPVVSTRVGGIPELVLPGITGLLVEPENPKELAQAITTLASNRALSRDMGNAGQARIRSEFSLDRMVTLTEDIYVTVVEASLHHKG